MRAVLITATDTGVGKTFISYNLAYALKEMGVRVGYYKPIETDVREVPADGSLVCSVTGQPVEEAVFFTYKLPLSPYAGILEEGKDFDLSELKERFWELQKRYEFLIVEGAGGVAVPIKKDYDYADLARDLNLPILLVARAVLGTLNHTYLSYYYIRSKGIDLVGIVMNGFEGKDISEKTNPLIIKERTGIEPFCIPRIEGLLLPPDVRKSLASLVGF
ncbi:dethiobiotin synthase [Thermocrinis minervae]|uniref:ATP-dependent dethiobiotin synthetase BioD n=1 Tax=Thermocrinis minervae TaxID=381751 RepID=A0A1M6TE61_9AQUI|nr:dethiobiotin synthase [Thermocrinis minervae]SHK55164.1 dethiobiotin synthetase [Thermocrinis minervae]